MKNCIESSDQRPNRPSICKTFYIAYSEQKLNIAARGKMLVKKQAIALNTQGPNTYLESLFCPDNHFRDWDPDRAAGKLPNFQGRRLLREFIGFFDE